MITNLENSVSRTTTSFLFLKLSPYVNYLYLITNNRCVANPEDGW